MTPNVGVRTVPPFVNGLWLDLLKLTACEAPKLGIVIGADVSYRPTGRLAQVATTPCACRTRACGSRVCSSA
jgi:hypothetical protein